MLNGKALLNTDTVSSALNEKRDEAHLPRVIAVEQRRGPTARLRLVGPAPSIRRGGVWGWHAGGACGIDIDIDIEPPIEG